jgi:large subunit ribosomal protein L20
MARVKRGTTAHAKHKKMLSLTKGYKHGRSKIFRLAKQAVLKAGTFAYRDRKVKKRTFRAHWITVLSAAVKQHDMTYSQFINGLNKAEITLNRRVLSELAQTHPDQFTLIVDQVKKAL